MKIKTASYLLISLFLSSFIQAASLYDDDFSTDPNLATAPWYNEGTSDPATYDGANQQVDYAHTAGVIQRLVNYDSSGARNSLTQMYMKVVISNFTGADASNGARIC